jgi:DNA-binding NarL/FixJ family response regulator
MAGTDRFEAEVCRLRSLTAREREVVALVGEGCREREIARRLRSNPAAVVRHLRAVSRKLGVGSRLELIILCYRHQLVDPRVPSQAGGHGGARESGSLR